MLITFMFYSYLLCLVVPVILGLCIFARLDRGMRIIWLLMTLTFLSELAAGLVGLVAGNNLFVYHLYTPLSFLVVVWYYHHRLPAFRRYKLAYLIGMAGMAAEVWDTLFYHSYDEMDAYAILITACCGLGMVLLDFGQCYLRGRDSLIRNPHLRVSLLLGLFWCASAMMLGSGMVFSSVHYIMVASLQFLWGLNILVYLGFGYVFFSLKSSSYLRS